MFPSEPLLVNQLNVYKIRQTKLLKSNVVRVFGPPRLAPYHLSQFTSYQIDSGASMYSKAPLSLILILTVITSLHIMLVSRDQVHHFSAIEQTHHRAICTSASLTSCPYLYPLPPTDSLDCPPYHPLGLLPDYNHRNHHPNRTTNFTLTSDPSTPLSQAPSTTSTESEIMPMFTGNGVLPECVLLFYYLYSSSWHYLIMRLFYCKCPVALP